MPTDVGTARRLGAIVVVTALASGGTAAQCPPADILPATRLTVTPGTVSYSRQHDIGGLAELRRRNGRAATRRGAAVGITTADPTFTIDTKVLLKPQGGGRYCAYLTEAVASLGYGRIQVYLARDYQRGSCPHTVIREHEDRHVAVFRNTLARFAPLLRARLAAQAARMAPLSVTDPEAAANRMQDQLNRHIEPILAEFQQTMDQANARLDSPAAYAAEQARCVDW